MSLLVMALAGQVSPTLAHADGDPASDVLLGANVFYPYETVRESAEKTLTAATAALAGMHDRVKVAVIATPSDLGAVPTLFDKPAVYAKFLDIELSFSGPPALLVVMPDGYGTSHLSAAATEAVARLPAPAGGGATSLVQAAARAEAQIASADGHSIASIVGTAGPGRAAPSPAHRLSFVVVVLAAVAVAATTAVALLTYLARRQNRR